ncbi:MAG: DUF2849 domain-containing protein [Rhodobacteraceae bacterium]|nr:DUF2849 domain-containing protein [Paracoccaceae bacterium]
MPKPFTPQVVTANDLFDGDVVYLTAAHGWSREHGDAAVAGNEEAATALLAAATEQPGKIVGPYLADSAIGADGRPAPAHYREAIRTLGPSNRTDLGKQAEGAA